MNGQAFLAARDALRGRVPLVVEWKGAHRAPGDEVVPADLRVDHVYLVSCKYLSRIVVNASPHHLFDRAARGRARAARGGDWFRRGRARRARRAVRDGARAPSSSRLPDDVDALDAEQRARARALA